MPRRRILGLVLMLAGAGAFVAIWRSIGWMVYGGPRDYLQLGGLLLAIVAVMLGLWLATAGARARPS